MNGVKSMPLVNSNVRYTYQDLLNWDDEERWELIDGYAYNMFPAPEIKHQDVARNLFRVLDRALEGKECTPYFPATDVVLSENDVVQPDIFVVCDKGKITVKNVKGAPDLIIEILSPSSVRKDRFEKRNLYELYGVKEYLIVDPEEQFVEAYRLNETGQFGKSEMYSEQEKLPLTSLPGLTIPLWQVFEVEFQRMPSEK